MQETLTLSQSTNRDEIVKSTLIWFLEISVDEVGNVAYETFCKHRLWGGDEPFGKKDVLLKTE